MQAGRRSGLGRAAGGAEVGGAAAARTLHRMLAGQGVPWFFPQHPSKTWCAKEAQEGLIGKDDLPRLIEHQHKAGKTIQHIQQLTVTADRLTLAFDVSLRAARELGYVGRTEVVGHIEKQDNVE